MAEGGNGAVKKRAKSHRSRITNGRRLLPSVHPQSVWARLYRDTLDSMISHLGGHDYATEPQRMIARHVSVLDAELRYQADRIGRLRQDGKEPEHHQLDLYARLANSQRRHIETLGLSRVAKDITASVKEQLLTEARQKRTAGATDIEEAGEV
jgi:hypothetical protein